ncbi:MAG: peptidoglycan DD-metalloendopeptidase family protein, partial [Deltaproteobacteria bacterium]|nr:peptidoglycan DD-metalloendopeptidase family protein [Deltaproteobacteria bacterium]
QEMHGEIALLGANEDVQKEIIQTNRANRLEALSRVRSLRESEHELETMLANFHASEQQQARPLQKSPPPLSAAGPERLSFNLNASGSAAHFLMKPKPELPAQSVSAIQKPLSPMEVVKPDLVALRGKLPFPVDGRVASAFGKSYNPKTNLLTFQKGITIEAAPMIEVKAVSDGKVVFAGPLKNYGLIAIVEHPGQYYTLYGQMGSVAKAEGAEVKRGHVLGKTSGEPLYFEIRNKNVAIDPVKWLLNGSITLSKQ